MDPDALPTPQDVNTMEAYVPELDTDFFPIF